jgi:hypothetical protein
MGSAAGALIGLQFVVITLIANRANVAGQAQAGDAFATPTIVHFGAVLLLAGIVTAPWPGLATAAHLWSVMGACGLIYEVVVLRRMRTQKVYTPEFEDWLFHFVLPLAAYAGLAGSAYVIRFRAAAGMFAVGAAALLLLFIGIHNAWDAVTYHIFSATRRAESKPIN